MVLLSRDSCSEILSITFNVRKSFEIESFWVVFDSNIVRCFKEGRTAISNPSIEEIIVFESGGFLIDEDYMILTNLGEGSISIIW